ncbi:MAG: pilus assembly protein TadG-related protein [Rhizomicrobium sp.]
MRCYVADSRGAISVLAALAGAVALGIAGLGIDFGYVYYCQDRLQTSTDSAALAGAEQINVGAGGTASAVATSYSSSGSGSLNRYSQVTATMAPGYPVLKCLTSIGVSCNGPDNANAIEVSQQAIVPTFFARLFGLGSWSISATSLASSKGGTVQPVDIEIILDTTASMNTVDPSCSSGGATREDCALAGVRTLLASLDPCSDSLSSCGTVTDGNVANPVDRVGLLVFPGLTAGQTQYEYDCSNSPAPAIAKYSASPEYQIVPFSSDYRTSDSAATLSTSSTLVLAARGGSGSCAEGLEATGGVGTFYADAITEAQTELSADGRATARKVIILLSDGAANASAPNMPITEALNQCHEGVSAAEAATSAGTWVYSISYGSSTATAPSLCTTDVPVISSCTTMQEIASDSTKYFSDISGGDAACTSQANPISQLSQIFKYIGTDASTARLLPLDTT